MTRGGGVVGQGAGGEVTGVVDVEDGSGGRRGRRQLLLLLRGDGHGKVQRLWRVEGGGS